MADTVLLKARRDFSRAAHERTLDLRADEAGVRAMRGNISGQNGAVLTKKKLDAQVKGRGDKKGRIKPKDKQR